MPSPFPGMDPFIESQKWEDFHSAVISVMREMLIPQVRPQYVVEIERYVFLVEHDEDVDEVVQIVAPDVTDTGHAWRETAATTATLPVKPVKHRIPMPQRRQPYLVIRTRRRQPVVTVIEVLSPTNKRSGPGQAEYMTKRLNLLRSSVNLVEVDLLRSGVRLPTLDPLQPGDYYAFVSRPDLRPEVDVFAWALQLPLPKIPIPLVQSDPDVLLDLQAAVTTTYDRGGYDYSLDYTDSIEPTLVESDATWAAAILTRAGIGQS